LREWPADQVCAAADAQGVLPLLAARFADQRLVGPVAEQLRVRARGHAAADVVRDAELRALVERLHARGVRAVLIKGAQLAYSHYARPDLRPRFDTDLFISADDRRQADDLLLELGYDRRMQSDGDLLTYQAPYVKTRQGAVVHLVDLHWRAVNPQRFGHVLDHAEAAAQAVAIPSLPHARGLCAEHALLLACVHRVAHHYGSDSLIWLYDLHLLSEAMTRDQWTRFVALADGREVGAICRQGLMLAHACFGTVVPPGLRHVGPDTTGTDRSALYLERQRHVRRVYWDLQALPGWTARLRLVRQHLFPPRQYMRTVYAPASHAPLPVLYAVRALRGARKWMART
jgi:hypothetical protein